MSGDLITREALENALDQLGVCNGDVVFVHSDLRQMGLVRRGGKIALAVEPEELLAGLVSLMGSAGTIAVPTFTTDGNRHSDFDPTTTPGNTGTFSELIRKQPGALRTRHPMVSVAAWGPMAEEMLNDTDMSGFGENSPFARMGPADVRMLMIGVPLCSYKDHIEWRHRVPYRYEKSFRTAEGRHFSHHVRYRVAGRELQMTTFLEGLTDEERTKVATVNLGKGAAHAISATDMERLLQTILTEDPFRFVTDDLDLQAEMTFLKEVSGILGVPKVQNSEDGELWCWQSPDDDAQICVKDAATCVRAAGSVLKRASENDWSSSYRARCFVTELRRMAKS